MPMDKRAGTETERTTWPNIVGRVINDDPIQLALPKGVPDDWLCVL